MIINHSHRFIFIHVPKAAGTTVTDILSRLTTYADLELGGTSFGEAIQPFYRSRFGLSKHSSCALVRQTVGDAVWQEFFSFGFVRNPFFRCLSTFGFLAEHIARRTPFAEQFRQADNEAVEAIGMAPGFNEFVLSGLLDKSDGFDGMFRPQVSWLSELEKPTEIAVTFVGKVENLAEDFDYCLRRIGSPDLATAGAELPQRNTSKRASATVALDAEAERIIAEKYERDFLVFGYSFENPFGRA